MPSFNHRASKLSTTLFTMCLAVAALPAAAQQVGVRALPEQPLLESTRDGQDLNFDLVFNNPGDKALTLERLEVTWFDSSGAFLGQRRLDQNGDDTTMGIVTVPNRTLPARGRLVVFNPFQHFRAPLWLGDLRYSAVFSTGEKDASEQRVELRVAPTAFAPRTALALPVSGSSFIHDGHDLTSHHRRLDITGDMTTHFGIAANFTRYAHDFCVTDAQGRLYRTDGATPEDWYGFGTPIVATGDGVVVEMHDGMPDNRKGAPPPFDQAAIMKNLKLFLGNYVILDHGNGEYSLFAHLKQGSVRVKAGQRVERGAAIGGMGMSGDAFLVHLHYQLQSGSGFDKEGLPAIFEGVQFATGHGWSPAATSAVDSGDIVRSAPAGNSR